MKRIGLLGGMSWESTIEYYRLVNELVAQELGGLHSADCLLRSIDFTDIEVLQREDRWAEAGERLAREAQALEGAGAELLVLCTNTMHKVAAEIELAITIPFIHIGDTTATAVKAAGHAKVGLLATGYTMEQDFYTGRMGEHGLDVIVPGREDRRIVHNVIYDELCRGVIKDGSRERVPPDHARARGRGRRGDPARLHGDRPARRPAGLAGAGLRHHAPARRARGHLGASRVAAAFHVAVTRAPGASPSSRTATTLTSATSGCPASSPIRARPPISVIETTSHDRWFWAEEGAEPASSTTSHG